MGVGDVGLVFSRFLKHIFCTVMRVCLGTFAVKLIVSGMHSLSVFVLGILSYIDRIY